LRFYGLYATRRAARPVQGSSRDPTVVHKTPAAENVLSASTDDGGILSKYLYTNFRPRPRLPLDSNIAISLRMDAIWDFSTSTKASVARRQTSGSEDRQTQACRISATANENKHGIVDILHAWLRYFELVRTLNYTVQVNIIQTRKTRVYRHPKPGFSGLEKSRVTRVFGFGKTRVGNPSLN